MQQKQLNDVSIGITLLLILIAYLFSIGARMYWPMYFAETPSMIYNNQLMINTNDGYFFASGAKDLLLNEAAEDMQRAASTKFGLTHLTALLVKITPFSLESITLYLSAVISSLLVIPVVLVGRLMGHTFLGFCAALIAGIAWSYYNRTMVGYFDSDMFSIFLQFSIFYTLLHIVYKKDLSGIFIASLLILVYPYFYPQGISITYAMFIILIVYLIFEERGWIKITETEQFNKQIPILYMSIILLSIVLMITLPVWSRIVLFGIATILIGIWLHDNKKLIYLAIIMFIGFLYFGNFFNVLTAKLMGYISRGVTEEGLHFFQVIQTVREAGSIPMETVANRISGSSWGLLLAFIGFIVLVFRHKPFIIALPLIGVGLFSYIGGLRFTVYAVPIAAISAVYLFWFFGSFLKEKKLQYALVIMGTIGMLYPNIQHIIGYKVPTVLSASEVEDLSRLNTISSRKDYTLSWWDYGYPIWYYSDTSTLIDGGKHHNDNFIISTVMQTSSPELAANLSRLAIETYVDSNYSNVANTIFKNKQEDQVDPNILLAELENNLYKVPKKTRDIYLYLPYRMLNIFPTVLLFGNIDLTTGKPIKRVEFYPTHLVKNENGILRFGNGISFNTKQKEVFWGQQRRAVKYFIVTQNTNQGKIQIHRELHDPNGSHIVIYMKSYNRFVIMDTEIFKSMYVQMFILGKYDKNLFELVISSPYSKIYKLKK